LISLLQVDQPISIARQQIVSDMHIIADLSLPLGKVAHDYLA
jgi:acetoacetate decarboxylase